MREFYDNMFRNGSIPLINKPTRVTSSSTTLIDNMCTNAFFEPSLKKAIIKTSISDHFPVIAALNISKVKTEEKYKSITKRIFTVNNKTNFFNELNTVDWLGLENCKSTNATYDKFHEMFYNVYDKNFPKITKKVRIKDLRTPWFTKGMKKSSRIKQKLYIKFLKTKTKQQR